MCSITAINDEMREMGIVYNPHTTASLRTLTHAWDSHKSWVANFIDNLQSAKALKEKYVSLLIVRMSCHLSFSQHLFGYCVGACLCVTVRALV